MAALLGEGAVDVSTLEGASGDLLRFRLVGRGVVIFQNHLSRQLFHLSRISRLYYSIHVTSARDRASGMGSDFYSVFVELL